MAGVLSPLAENRKTLNIGLVKIGRVGFGHQIHFLKKKKKE